jgi:hypothetical protein
MLAGVSIGRRHRSKKKRLGGMVQVRASWGAAMLRPYKFCGDGFPTVRFWGLGYRTCF